MSEAVRRWLKFEFSKTNFAGCPYLGRKPNLIPIVDQVEFKTRVLVQYIAEIKGNKSGFALTPAASARSQKQEFKDMIPEMIHDRYSVYQGTDIKIIIHVLLSYQYRACIHYYKGTLNSS